MSPDINKNRFQEMAPILNVSDFKEAMDYFVGRLDFSKGFEYGDPPDFGSVGRDGIEIFLCKDGQGQSGTWIQIFLDDVDQYFQDIKTRGAKILSAPEDKPWGVREMQVQIPNDHVIRFGSSKPEKDFKITRKAVDARIEERLLGVVSDLAKETNRTVGEVLEETLLHGFEPVSTSEGQAVASPHTKAQFQLIEVLKKKHKLDYETHDNYRFTED